MVNNFRKRVIDLDPFEVEDETLAALEAEIRKQHDDELDSIENVSVFVLDTNADGGLDSHATVFEQITHE
jgi:hypothetical protein